MAGAGCGVACRACASRAGTVLASAGAGESVLWGVRLAAGREAGAEGARVEAAAAGASAVAGGVAGAAKDRRWALWEASADAWAAAMSYRCVARSAVVAAMVAAVSLSRRSASALSAATLAKAVALISAAWATLAW